MSVVRQGERASPGKGGRMHGVCARSRSSTVAPTVLYICIANNVAIPGVPWTRSDWLSQYRESRSISLHWSFNPADALHWLLIENHYLISSLPLSLSLIASCLSVIFYVIARRLLSIYNTKFCSYNRGKSIFKTSTSLIPTAAPLFGNILMHAW